MKRLAHLLIWLYPSSWRSRYQVEYDALLDDVEPTGRASLNVLAGAIVMHLRTPSWRKILASSSCIGLLLGLGTWRALPNQYSSRAIMELYPANTKLFTAEANAALTRPILTRIIQKEKLYPAGQGKMPLEDLVAQMKNKIEFWTADPNSVAIQFRYSDPFLAQRVSSKLVQAILSGT